MESWNKGVNQWYNCIPFLIICILVLVLGYICCKDAPKQTSTQIYLNQVDSLQNKLDSLYKVEKEVDLRIDTITITLEKIKIKYEKERNIILNNTPSEDKQFFTNYINSNRERLYSNYNN